MRAVAVLKEMRGWLEALVVVALLAGVVAAAASHGRSRLTAKVYASRLAALHADYEHLRAAFNEAVARAAVTELRVDRKTVTVVIRSLDGQVRELATPCDPEREIYVDFVVLDNRLWIRRVFDAATPPSEAFVVDPELAHVDWQSTRARLGQAVYRRLEPGRWVVTVTGNGALGLEKTDSDSRTALVAAPPVRDFAAITEGIGQDTARISLTDMLRAALRAP